MRAHPLYPGEILRATVGSTAHGLALAGTDDLDQMGVCVETLTEAMGVGVPFEQHIYRTATARTGDPNARSAPGDLDLTVFSLRKYLRLALKGNPTVLVPLFTDRNALVYADARGHELQNLVGAIVSRRAVSAFLGYLTAQRERLMGERGMKVNRPELVARHGYDTKFAMHALRLGHQGLELADTGRISLPLPEPACAMCMDVRRGQISKDAVVSEIRLLETKLCAIRDGHWPTMLRREPDTARVERWMLDVYRAAWAPRNASRNASLDEALNSGDGVCTGRECRALS